MKVLMVCYGNICRSPLAQGILERKVEERDLDWEIDSAATAAYHVGEPPDERSIQVARQQGLDISGQRARMLSRQDLDDYDVILCMDRPVWETVRAMCRTDAQRDKVKLIGDYMEPSGPGYIPDPYYHDFGAFEYVYDLLDDALERFVKHHNPE